MHSNRIFFAGWLGSTLFLVLSCQSILVIFTGLVSPIFLFDHWAHLLCYHHFDMATTAWYTPIWRERNEMYIHWRKYTLIAFLSIFYLCAYLPFILPDRLWRCRLARSHWTAFIIIVGMALGIYGIIKYNPLDLPQQRWSQDSCVSNPRGLPWLLDQR